MGEGHGGPAQLPPGRHGRPRLHHSAPLPRPPSLDSSGLPLSSGGRELRGSRRGSPGRRRPAEPAFTCRREAWPGTRRLPPPCSQSGARFGPDELAFASPLCPAAGQRTLTRLWHARGVAEARGARLSPRSGPRAARSAGSSRVCDACHNIPELRRLGWLLSATHTQGTPGNDKWIIRQCEANLPVEATTIK